MGGVGCMQRALPIGEHLAMSKSPFTENKSELEWEIRPACSSRVEKNTKANAVLMILAIPDGGPHPKLVISLAS